MPAKDLFHEAVRNALQKEGWTITDDPLFIRFGIVELYVDLGAERIIAAEKDAHKIAVEVKSFVAPSVISEFYTALGQFMSYRLALEAQNTSRTLYLAVPIDTYTTFFVLPFAQAAIQRYGLKLIVYRTEREEIVQWHE